MDYNVEQLRKMLHMEEQRNEEEIILSAKAMVENIELVIATTTDHDVKRIAKSKLQMLQQYMPVNEEEKAYSKVQGEMTKPGGKRLIRARLCNDRYLSIEDREKWNVQLPVTRQRKQIISGLY